MATTEIEMCRGGPCDEDFDRCALAALARRILAGGLTWAYVDAAWPKTCAALGGCDPSVVAALDGEALEALAATQGILHGRSRMLNVVRNAQAFVDVAAEHGSVRAWLRGLRRRPWPDRVGALRERLQGVQERNAWRWLGEIGEPIPDEPPWLDG